MAEVIPTVGEADRLRALDRYSILDTPTEQGFDDIVMLASQICETPTAMISFVASDRQWFKARVGFGQCETPRSQSICAHALQQPGLLVIPDLTADPRTCRNTLVTGFPNMRFYAGARLETLDGVALGTLCVIDTAPRPDGLTPKQGIFLEALGRQVMTQMELRHFIAEQNNRILGQRISERRQSFLFGLSDQLRVESGPRARMQAAVDALGRYLKVSRVGYGLVENDNETVSLETEYVAGVVRLEGRYPLRAFGSGNIANLRTGRTSVYPSVEADPGTAGIGLGNFGIAALLAVPQMQAGQLRSVIYVNHREPRLWAPEEVALVEEVAARFWDAVERARAEDALRAMNETLEAKVAEKTRERDRIWHVSQDMLGVADFNGVWLSVNPAWQRTLGWGSDEIVGRTAEWLEHPDDREQTQAELAGLTAGHPTQGFENRLKTKDGDYRTLSWTAVPVEGLLYCVSRDVTAQKAQAETLTHAQDALRQSQKMEALGQLTGGIAHDFNNLLTGILGSVDLVQRRLAAGRHDDIARFLDAASTSAQSAAALTHRLLAFARRQSLDTKPNDVNRLVMGMEDLLQRTLGEHVGLKTELAGGLWLAMTDAHQLENAILNLAINARDAMPDGGHLTIETANTHLDLNYAQQNDDVEAGDYVALSVSDTGTGMPPDVVARAFDPFFTTKPIGLGSGLGLSMIYGFAKQSRGHLRIYSEVGRGTSVKLYLARATIEMNEAEHGAVVETPRGCGETILVVEDDATVRMLIISVLDELGYRYLEAPDAPAAIAFLRTDRQIDLLMTDVGLPVMNGLQLGEFARESRPMLKVLYVTGYAENAAVRGGFLSPGMDMLTKPFALDMLGTKIREMIER